MKGGGQFDPKWCHFYLAAPRGYLSHNICHNLTISHKTSLQPLTASHSPRASTILQSFRTSTPEHFGTGIYLVASLLNHSCSPNCTVVFQGRQLSIVATKDVPSGIRSYLSLCHYVRLAPHSLEERLFVRKSECQNQMYSILCPNRLLLLRLHPQCGSHHLRQQPWRHEHAARAAQHHLALPLWLLPLRQQEVRSDSEWQCLKLWGVTRTSYCRSLGLRRNKLTF